MRIYVIAILAVCALTTVARADNKFHAVPGNPEQLQLRVVEYNGGTNGELTVQVKNRSKEPVKFAANGLYFVPDGNANEAPQRLGAVGPMQMATGKATTRKTSVVIPAGKTVELTLDVFCIDSHRKSPSSETPFTIAKTKIPASLARTIDVRASKAAAKSGGYAAPAAKSEIQSEVWKSRDSKWIELDGEGAQEASK